MKNNFLKNILLLVVTATLFACSYSHESGGQPDEVPPTGLTDPKPGEGGEEPTVRFADVDSAVFKTSCAGCHQGRGLELNFADHANSKTFAAEIFDRVFVVGDMPPKKKLTQLQLQVLRIWLDTGSPE